MSTQPTNVKPLTIPALIKISLLRSGVTSDNDRAFECILEAKLLERRLVTRGENNKVCIVAPYSPEVHLPLAEYGADVSKPCKSCS